MNTELVVVMPHTGELIELANASVERLVEARATLLDLTDQIADARHALDGELAARLDAANLEDPTLGYTHRIAGYKVSVPSPTAGGTVDDEALRADLLTHHLELDLPQHAIEALFERKITHTRRRQPWARAAKLRPALNRYLERHSKPATSRRVSITRLPQFRDVIDATAVDESPHLQAGHYVEDENAA